MQVRAVMTGDPVVLPASTTIGDAAVLMRDRKIGDVLVVGSNGVTGIVTDRDIVVRAVATGRDLSKTTVGDICTTEPATVGPDDDSEVALRVMAKRAVRRLPVVDRGLVVGVITLNDISGTTDVGEVTAEIAAAPPND
jgi:CBS domain-containing protein